MIWLYCLYIAKKYYSFTCLFLVPVLRSWDWSGARSVTLSSLKSHSVPPSAVGFFLMISYALCVCVSFQVQDKLPHLKAIIQYKDELKEKKPNLYTVHLISQIFSIPLSEHNLSF